MANLYNDFEKRYADKFFSANWVEVEVKQVQTVQKKDLQTLEEELQNIEATIELISQKQLRLSNLARFYQ